MSHIFSLLQQLTFLHILNTQEHPNPNPGSLIIGISDPNAGSGGISNMNGDEDTQSHVTNSNMEEVKIVMHVAPKGLTAAQGGTSFISVSCLLDFYGANVEAEAFWGKDAANFDQWAIFVGIAVGEGGDSQSGGGKMKGDISSSGPAKDWSKSADIAGGLPALGLAFLFNSFKGDLMTSD